MRWANKYPLAPNRRREDGTAVIRFPQSAGLFILALFAAASTSASEFDFGFGNQGSGNAKCFLSGSIRPLNAGTVKKGFQSLENRLRLSFDANDPQTCERYIKSYCQNNILGKGDIPVKLAGYFRPARVLASEADKKPTHIYEVTE